MYGAPVAPGATDGIIVMDIQPREVFACPDLQAVAFWGEICTPCRTQVENQLRNAALAFLQRIFPWL